MKDYRNDELRTFVAANIIVILFLIGKLDDLVYSDLLSTGLLSIVIYAYIIVADILIPSKAKYAITNLWMGLPSYSAFKDFINKDSDVSKEFLELAKSDGEQQHKRWKEIYSICKNRNIIKDFNSEYLMCRDMSVSIVTLLVIYLVMCMFCLPFSWLAIGYLLFMFIAMEIATRQKGNRLVREVLIESGRDENE